MKNQENKLKTKIKQVMKKYLVVTILAVLLASCASQPTKISWDIDRGNLEEASKQLNRFFEEEEAAKQDPEAWLVKADLCMQVFISEDPEQKNLFDNPLHKAYEALNKAEELDYDNEHLLEIHEKRLVLSEQMFMHGLSYYENDDYKNASKKFYKSFLISEQFQSLDTMTLFNAALAAEQSGLNDDASKYYQRLIELELDEPYIYTGISNIYIRQRGQMSVEISKNDVFIKAYNKRERIDSIFKEIETERELQSVLSRELDIFADIAELIIEEKPHEYDKETIEELKAVNDSLKNKSSELEENALTYIKKGREKYPDNIELIFSEANYYLLIGKSQEAKEILDVAIEKEPDNEALYFAFGANYEEMARDELLSEEERKMAIEEAIKAYKKAIEINDEYADAYYNLGALYFNKGIRIFEEADEELRENRDFEQYKKAEESFQEYWLKAQPHLEKAKSLIEADNPNYEGIISSLNQLYIRTDQHEKQQKLNEEYEKHFEGQPEDN